MDSLTLKRHNSFKNRNNRKATHSFALRPLIFKLQQKLENSVISSRVGILKKRAWRLTF